MYKEIENMCRNYDEKEIQFIWNNKSNKPKCNLTYIQTHVQDFFKEL